MGREKRKIGWSKNTWRRDVEAEMKVLLEHTGDNCPAPGWEVGEVINGLS